MTTNNAINSNQSLKTTDDVTFDSVAFSNTTKGIIGTTTNDNAAAGSVGQFVTSVIAASPGVTLNSSGIQQDVTSISLTAGDWDVWGNVAVSSATMTLMAGWVSSSSATIPDLSLYNPIPCNAAVITNTGLCVPGRRFSLSTTTTIYLTATANFSGSATACGGIYARRVR